MKKIKIFKRFVTNQVVLSLTETHIRKYTVCKRTLDGIFPKVRTNRPITTKMTMILIGQYSTA